jgi:glucosamine-phosphate N-acetyltransferase
MVEIKELVHTDISQDFIDILHDAFKHPKISLSRAKQRMKLRYAQNIHTFGIYLDGNLIGTAGVIIELKMFNDQKPYIAHIEDVAIHRDQRGFGYGKQLIEHVIEFCRKKDCYKIVLFCSNDNIKFYKKCGFRNSCNLMRKDLD